MKSGNRILHLAAPQELTFHLQRTNRSTPMMCMQMMLFML